MKKTPDVVHLIRKPQRIQLVLSGVRCFEWLKAELFYITE